MVSGSQAKSGIAVKTVTTLLTSPIKFSLYFQYYVKYLDEKFREVRKIYETGVRSKLMRVNLFYQGTQTFEHSKPCFRKSQKSIH